MDSIYKLVGNIESQNDVLKLDNMIQNLINIDKNAIKNIHQASLNMYLYHLLENTLVDESIKKSLFDTLKKFNIYFPSGLLDHVFKYKFYTLLNYFTNRHN